MTIGTMNLCSVVSVYILLWGIVMDQLWEGYNAAITEWGWRATLCNSDRRRKNPFSLCVQHFSFKKNPADCLGAVKHWFNGLWCHQHAQKGTLAHTQTHPDRTITEVSLELTLLRTWWSMVQGPRTKPRLPKNHWRVLVVSRPGSVVTHVWHSDPLILPKAVGCQAELPSPHASIESCFF